jgi:hypothetical protein
MHWVIEAHLLTARHLFARGDTQAAVDEVDIGLLHAATCGFGLLRIELLVALARIRLAWPDAPKAIQASREALDLASHPECGYAWGARCVVGRGTDRGGTALGGTSNRH